MELLVATWTLRFALVASLAVGALTISVGGSAIDAVDRAVLAAFAFTFFGRQLIGWLESPQQRMLRLRARRTKKQPKSNDKSTAKSNDKPNDKPSAKSKAKEDAKAADSDAATNPSTTRSRAA